MSTTGTVPAEEAGTRGAPEEGAAAAAEEAGKNSKRRFSEDEERVIQDRIKAAAARREKEVREAIAEESKRNQLSEVEKLRHDKAASDAALAAEKTRVLKLDRGIQLRDAAAGLGYVPAAYIRVAIEESADADDFDPNAIAAKLREAYLEDVKRETGAATLTKKETATTTGVLAPSGDMSKWSTEQAVAHSRTLLKPGEAMAFLDQWERATGRKR